MTFTVGETVVYPNHGAAVIEDIEMRTIKGEDRQYLVLRIVSQQDLVVRVPACNLDLVGVRDVVDKEGLDRVFVVLRAAHVEEPTNWSRRYKANLEKLHSGDVMKVSEVVRDLWRRERDRGLSAGEKRMLAKARQILVSELALAEKTNEDKAEAMLDEVLASCAATPLTEAPGTKIPGASVSFWTRGAAPSPMHSSTARRSWPAPPGPWASRAWTSSTRASRGRGWRRRGRTSCCTTRSAR